MAVLSFLDREHSIAGRRTTRAGSCRRRRSRSICRSARRTRSACSIFRCRSAIGITDSAPDDWKLSTIGWVFSVAIVFLGLSAAVFGAWLERVGPRKAMFVVGAVLRRRIPGRGARRRDASVLAAAARLRRARRHRARTRLHLAGVDAHQVVSRPARAWRPGMAIMGFGGGAMIASPLSTMLMAHFKTPTSQGVAPTFVVDGRALLRVHDVRRVHRARAARRAGGPRVGRRRQRRKRMIDDGQRDRATARSRRRSSGCCGSCCA